MGWLLPKYGSPQHLAQLAEAEAQAKAQAAAGQVVPPTVVAPVQHVGKHSAPKYGEYADTQVVVDPASLGPFTIPRMGAETGGTFVERAISGTGGETVTVGELKRYLAAFPDNYVLHYNTETAQVLGIPLPAHSAQIIASPPS